MVTTSYMALYWELEWDVGTVSMSNHQLTINILATALGIVARPMFGARVAADF
jgi:hypothetical protein